ncbi:hypothetical protein ZWY2020_025286 [Hordeum vulgare]|nr:hypothetical protein ZWY2020_025286 [Hordeum vulgare]
MDRRSVANINILLVLSLGAALVIAGRPADIRLPSDRKGLGADAKLGAMKKVLEEDERPWACCDDTHCLRMIPKVCGCRAGSATRSALAATFAWICTKVGPARSARTNWTSPAPVTS